MKTLLWIELPAVLQSLAECSSFPGLNEFDGAMIVRVKHLESAYGSKVHRQRIRNPCER